jgi:hypothetical protein
MSKVPRKSYVQPIRNVDASNAPLNQSLSSDADATVVRAVIAGEQSNGSYANVNVSDMQEFLTTTLAASTRSLVAYEDTAVEATQYILLIDLDNTGGIWPHTAGDAIDLDHLSASTVFATGTAEAVLRLGVVMRIDSTDADIMWLINRRSGTQAAKDTVSISDNYQPSSVHFEQDGTGGVVGARSSVTDFNLAAVNTATSLASPAGPVEPGLGDVIMKLEWVADDYAVDVSALYHAT